MEEKRNGDEGSVKTIKGEKQLCDDNLKKLEPLGRLIFFREPLSLSLSLSLIARGN